MKKQTDFDIVTAFDFEAEGFKPGELVVLLPLRQPTLQHKSQIGDRLVPPRSFATMEFTADEIERRLSAVNATYRMVKP